MGWLEDRQKDVEKFGKESEEYINKELEKAKKNIGKTWEDGKKWLDKTWKDINKKFEHKRPDECKKNCASKSSLEAIANDPTISGEIDAAWEDSNPNTPGEKVERGFWILRNDDTGQYSVQHFPTSNATRHSLTPGPTPDVPGHSVEAFFHTHPNTVEEGYTSEPSQADISFGEAIGVPGIVRSHDGMHYFGY